MKSALLILIGYITCSLKCEMNEAEGVMIINSETVLPPERIETTEQSEVMITTHDVDTADKQDYTKQKDGTIIKPVDGINAEEQPDNLEQPDIIKQQEVTTIISSVDGTDAGRQPDNLEQVIVVNFVPATDTMEGSILSVAGGEHLNIIKQPKVTITGEQPDIKKQQEDTTIIPSVDTTDVGEKPDNSEQPVVVKLLPTDHTTNAGEQAGNMKQQEYVEKTKTTQKQDIQADDTGPAKIKVDDALKLLENSKKIYALESIALIKRLEWLRSTFNITELEIEHKIDPKSFDYLSNTGNNLNSSNISRRGGLKEDAEFVVLKKAILKERGKSLKQKFYRPTK